MLGSLRLCTPLSSTLLFCFFLMPADEEDDMEDEAEDEEELDSGSAVGSSDGKLSGSADGGCDSLVRRSAT